MGISNEEYPNFRKAYSIATLAPTRIDKATAQARKLVLLQVMKEGKIGLFFPKTTLFKAKQ
jgi:hypothetical protein